MGLTREHRRSLLDQIDPGDRRLKAGLILTYSADAAPLVAVLSTLAGHSLTGEEAAGQGLQDEFRIMRDIESLTDRVRVLMNVGGLRTPGGSGDRMAALLDAVVREVVPMKHGKPNPGSSFHPKLLLFEYEPKETATKAAPDIRMFICTRNVTTDDSMDTIVSLRLIAQKSPSENGKRIRKFLNAALAETGAPVPSEISSLVDRVEKMDLEPLQTSVVAERIEFFGQIPGGDALSAQTKNSTSGITERIIVSPFIDKTTLGSLMLNGGAKPSLLSERRDFNKLCSLKDGDQFLAKNFDCYEINRDGDQSFHSLHAKMILDKATNATIVTVGSANATVRAWGGANWEAVVRFEVPNGYFRKTFSDLFEDSESENKAALCVPFLPVSEEKVDDPPEELFKNLIARAPLSYSVRLRDNSIVFVNVAISPDDVNRQIKNVFFRVLGEAEGHSAEFENGTWKFSWEVPIASFSSILAIDASFVTEGGTGTIRVNRCMNVDAGLISRRNQSLLAELVQTQGIHEILAAILEGVGFGFAPDPGDGAGASWMAGDGAGLPVANLETLIFLCLKDDPESLAKRSMISDIMNAEFSDLPAGADADRAERNRKLFESVKKIWKQLDAEYPMRPS